MRLSRTQICLSLILATSFVLNASEVAFACSYAIGGPPPDLSGNPLSKAFVILSILTIIGIFGAYFGRGKQGLWIVVATIIGCIVLTPLTIFGGIVMCGEFAPLLFIDLAIFASLFLTQLALWGRQAQRTARHPRN